MIDTNLKKIAKFYNDYQVINFHGDMEEQKEAMTKQMDGLVNVILPCLVNLSEGNEDALVSEILVSLVGDGEDLIPEKKFIEVQNNLKEMRRVGEQIGFDQRLINVINALVP